MSQQRQMHLGAFMRPVSIHTAWWRYPGSAADANFNLDHIKPGEEKWYTYSQDSLDNTNLFWISLAFDQF